MADITSTTGFQGLRGTEDVIANARPKNWREGLLLLFPNGDTPLTGFTGKGKSQSTTDPEFSWFEKILADQGGATSGIFTDAALSSAATSGAVAAGDLFYVNTTLAINNHFRIGHAVNLIKTGDDKELVYGKVIGKVPNGANSYIVFSTLTAQADTDVINNIDYVEVAGNLNPEGGIIPDSITYDSERRFNYTQIFRTPIEITRTMMQTKFRTGDQWAEMKREGLQYHGIELEQALIFGQRTENTGSNGKPERTSQGIVSYVTEHEPDNVIYYPSTTSLSWKAGGEDWLDETLEQLFRYGRRTKFAAGGSGAIRGLNTLAKQSGNFDINETATIFGTKFKVWRTPFGDILFNNHPLYSARTHRRNSLTILEPENIVTRIIQDTMFKDSNSMKESGFNAIDGKKNEWLTEIGWEFHHAKTMMHLSGVGVDGI